MLVCEDKTHCNCRTRCEMIVNGSLIPRPSPAPALITNWSQRRPANETSKMVPLYIALVYYSTGPDSTLSSSWVQKSSSVVQFNRRENNLF